MGKTDSSVIMKRYAEHRMPNGFYTKDVVAAARAWEPLLSAVEEMLGVRVTGYDPGISCSKGSHCFTIPLSVALHLQKIHIQLQNISLSATLLSEHARALAGAAD